MSRPPDTPAKPPSIADSVTFFREASPYIRQHRERIFVIAFPGEVIELANFRRLIQDIAIIAALGAKVVLVHGMRSQINARLQAQQHPVRFHDGLRVTDYEALLAAKETCGSLRIQLENILSFALAQPGFSQNDQIVTSGNFITARPVGVLNGVDYGYTGHVRRIQSGAILTQLAQGHLVLLSPLGYSPTGEAYNLSYEQLAIETAQALSADKVLILDDAPVTLPTALTLDEARHLQDQHPLLPQIIAALEHKVGRVHLLDANTEGALLMELYTRQGIGAMIAANATEAVRPATVDDIGGIMEVIRPLERNGTLVRRSREQLELEISRFQVIVLDQQIIGCAALYDTDDVQTGELACLAVDPNYRAANRGEQLLRTMVKTARQQGKTRLLVLTTQSAEWFREHGFQQATIDALPDNKKRLYNFKRNSKVFFLEL
ncbi:MAG: amino-acid N-acetyltransferase [Thiothrix nivea]|nr:MAG: amino-acid N-acetyltransferase [Thiothrix nivea]